MKKITVLVFLLLAVSYTVLAQESNNTQIPDKSLKLRFYDFNDLIIDGKIKKPQVLWSTAKQKVKFDNLLKLKKDFLPNVNETKKDPKLR